MLFRSQTRAVYVGLAFYGLTFILFAFATKGWMMFAFMIPSSLGGIAGPALQGIMSGRVPPNEQGELQGALTSLISLTSIVGPLVMTWLFFAFTRPDAPTYFPGAPFLAAGILSLGSLGFAWRTLRKS